MLKCLNSFFISVTVNVCCCYDKGTRENIQSSSSSLILSQSCSLNMAFLLYIDGFLMVYYSFSTTSTHSQENRIIHFAQPYKFWHTRLDINSKRWDDAKEYNVLKPPIIDSLWLCIVHKQESSEYWWKTNLIICLMCGFKYLLFSLQNLKCKLLLYEILEVILWHEGNSL